MIRTALGVMLGLLLIAPAFGVSPVFVHPTSPTCLGNGTAGVDCFNSLQDAIDNAGGANPSVVRVLAGTYGSGDLSSMASAIPEGPGSIVIEAFGNGVPSISPPAGSRGIENSSSPFPGNVTLRGLSVTSLDKDAIHLEGVTGDCTLDTLTVTGAGVDGADLRCDGAVTILDSHFDGNTGDGVEMTVGGPVLIERSSANDNEGPGIAPSGAEMGHNGFNIEIIDGSLTIRDSEANGNAGEGFEVHPADGTTSDMGSISSVLIEGSEARNNGRRGGVGSSNPIYPEVIRADGFQIEACLQGDGNTVGSDDCAIGDVTIRDSVAEGNSHDGFEIIAFGTITMERVTISENGDDAQGDGIDTQGWPDEVILRDLVVIGNADNGIQIEAPDAAVAVPSFDVLLERVTANNNGKSIPAWQGTPPPEPGITAGPGGDDQGIEIGNYVDNLVCRDCTMIDNGGAGGHLFARGTIEVVDMLAMLNNKTGVEIFSRRPIDRLDLPGGPVSCTNCVSRDNGQDAFQILGSSIEMDGCDASTSNLDDGVDVNAGRFDEEPVDLVQSMTVRNCILEGNAEQGLVFEGDDKDLVLETMTIENVCAVGNRTGLEPKGGGATLSFTNVQAIDNDRFGIRFDSTVGTNTVSSSNFSGNGEAGMSLAEEDSLVTATGNWWGDPSGPFDSGDNPGGMGDEVWDSSNGGGTGTIDFTGPAAGPFPDAANVCVRTLDLPTADVEFGPVPSGSSGKTRVTLSNPGTVPLVIFSIGPFGGPFSQTGGGSCGLPPFTINPGESCTIELAFEPPGEGPYVRTIDIESTADSSPSSLTLVGQGSGSSIPIPVLAPWQLWLLVVFLLLMALRGTDLLQWRNGQ